jgi:AcrR family transcriptional regulator
MNDKRQEIIEKVRELYHRYGIRSVTMDDVVREMGISKKTLYQYFTDKNELVKAVIDCDAKRKHIEHDESLKGASNAIEKMLGFYDFQMKMIRDTNPSMIFDLKKYYPEVHRDLVDQKRRIIYNEMLANLRQGKSEGFYRKEMDEEVISRLNLMRVESFINSNVFRPEEILTRDFFKEMFTYHMYGIVNDKGRELLEKNIDKLK